MRVCSINELKCKEVINLPDGRRLGFVKDAEFELPEGKLISITVPTESKCFNFGKCDEVKIPWCNIECIGEDTVLVHAGFLPPSGGGKK